MENEFRYRVCLKAYRATTNAASFQMERSVVRGWRTATKKQTTDYPDIMAAS